MCVFNAINNLSQVKLHCTVLRLFKCLRNDHSGETSLLEVKFSLAYSNCLASLSERDATSTV